MEPEQYFKCPVCGKKVLRHLKERQKGLKQHALEWYYKKGILKMWISRNIAGGLKLSINKPTLTEQGWWNAEDDTFFHINSKYFPEVTFENSPQEVELKLIEK